jgi:hypothetical protein
MTGHSVIHGIFTIERTYDAAPASVFAAFSTEEARNSWGETGDQQPSENGAARCDSHQSSPRYDRLTRPAPCPHVRVAGRREAQQGRHENMVASERRPW